VTDLTRIEDLERCFRKYPDVPEEVIIKEDCLRHGISWSAPALEASGKAEAQTKAYFLFQFDRSSRSNMQLDETVRAPEEIKIHGGEYKLKDTVIADHLSADSPYLVDMIDGRMQLCDRSDGNLKPITEVKVRIPPRYYHKTLPSGTPYWEIGAATMWAWNIFITVLRNCQHWGPKEECKFCDLNANLRELKKLGRVYVVEKSLEEVSTVIAEAFADYRGDPPTEAEEFESVMERGPHRVLFSGGTITTQIHGKRDADFYIPYVEAARSLIGGRFDITLQSTAYDKEDCRLISKAGATSHCANFEVWDERLFAIICPGKNRVYGRDTWIKRLLDSVDVFGEGNVFPGFVAGVEMAKPWGFEKVEDAVKSTTNGMEYLMSHGVIPRPITWCVEPLSALRDQSIVQLDYLIEIDRNWYELWTKYGLPIPSREPIGTGRGRYPNGAYCDMGPHE
jgi:hypothetical protein